MCRSIVPLHNIEPAASEDEARAAALQFVRKISGYRKPSKANEETFEAAVDEIAAISWRLLSELETAAPPRPREVAPPRAPGGRARQPPLATWFPPGRSGSVVAEQVPQKSLRVLEKGPR